MQVERLLQNLKTGQYSGTPIDLDLEDVDLKAVVSRLGEISGIPFELSPDIQTGPVMGWTYNKKGNIVADEATGKTSKKGVFAGGDIVTGAATVILAMGTGRTAARAIDAYLKDGPW